MTSIPSITPQATSPRSFGHRALRVVFAVPLAIIYVLFLGLAGYPLAGAPHLIDWVTFALVLLVPIVFGVVAHRRQLAMTWRFAGLYLIAVPVLAYLAADDPVLRHPITNEEIAPAFSGAEQSYDVLMRYGKNHPLGRDFRAPQRIFKGAPYVDSSKPDAWPKWLGEHRAYIEADWADLAAVRAWWAELAAFDRIGDLTAARYDAEIIAFEPVRSYSQHAMHIAGLQAIDGHGDEAFATLQPLLEVSRKLEPSSRTLVRFMIARVIQKTALETANFVLDHTAVSSAARARFAAALTGGSGGEAGARRLVGIEYPIQVGVFTHASPGDLVGPWLLRSEEHDFRKRLLHLVNALNSLVFNPDRTLNLIGDMSEQRQELAARRKIAELAPTDAAAFRNEARPRFKNLVGALFISGSLPAYTKVVETYWKIEDMRAALLERLNKM